MHTTTKFLLDSGDPDEYREISKLAKEKRNNIWGSTTNPTLIAKKLAGKKISQKEAFKLQEQIVLEILDIVPGAVSAEVYADETTKAESMIEQGREIATWHKRVVVKLPTTFEGFVARTYLRKEKIPVNNTLVFSQEQIFAICLHERLIQKEFGPTNDIYPPFISPFVGRLDDIGEDGMTLLDNGMKIKWGFDLELPKSKLEIWVLEASVRKLEHIQLGIDVKTELITAPAKLYREWFALSEDQQNSLTASYADDLKKPSLLKPSPELLSIDTIDEFMQVIKSRKLDIKHDLTDKGLVRFAQDWKTIIG